MRFSGWKDRWREIAFVVLAAACIAIYAYFVRRHPDWIWRIGGH